MGSTSKNEENSPKRQKLSFPNLESVLPDNLIIPIPLVNVYVVGITDSKNISKVIIDLNSKLPVVELQHLKRIKARDILLCPCSWISKFDPSSGTESILKFLTSKQVNLDYIDIKNVKIIQVAALPPKTKRQHVEINKIWPCNFHSNKYIEKLVENLLFSSKELELHMKLLRLTIEIGKLAENTGQSCCSDQCGAIVTDPLRNDLIIAGGYSMVKDNPILHSTMVAIDAVARTQLGGAYKDLLIDIINWQELLVGEFEELKVLQLAEKGQSCKNDVLTSEITVNEANHGKSKEIETLSERKSKKSELVEAPFEDEDEGEEELQELKRNNKEIIQFVEVAHKQEELNDREYLCTNYHVYMTHEPCMMCAMALIHSRAKRVFYLYPSRNGALGTTCKIHTVKELNHHYEVFRVVKDDLKIF